MLDFVERTAFESWIAGYEQAWRSPGTAALADLFAPDVTYLPSPWAQPIRGLRELAAFWDAEREGPDEQFTLASQVLAVDGDVGVARIDVDYGRGSRWRDLWVVRLDERSRCTAFEEWPFAPAQRDGHG